MGAGAGRVMSVQPPECMSWCGKNAKRPRFSSCCCGLCPGGHTRQCGTRQAAAAGSAGPATPPSRQAHDSFHGAEDAPEPSTGNRDAATGASSTTGESSEEELLATLRLADAVERDVWDERRRTQAMLQLGRDGLSVEAGSDCPERLADVDFRLQKDGWMLVSRFLEKRLGLRALGLVKAMTQ
jgi:hypothetical protein